MKIAWSRSAFRERILAATLLLATVALLYVHTLHAPFYLDDPGALAENYRLRDLSATLTQFFSQRGLTNLTFALNFHFTGWDLPPLHLTNIALHALCGILVWLLLRQLIPGHWLRLGEIAIKLGDQTTARQVAGKLAYADPQAWQRLEPALRSLGWLESR